MPGAGGAGCGAGAAGAAVRRTTPTSARSAMRTFSGVAAPAGTENTVTPDVAGAVKNAKAGQVQYRTDKAGIIHATIGRASFDVEKLQINLAALIDALNKARPAAAKGIYLRKVAVSSTMGGGARVELASLAA